MATSDHWHNSRNYLRRIVTLPCAQSGIDGERVDPGGRAFNHDLPNLVEVFSLARRYDPAKQHRSNCRFGRRIDCVRFGRNDAGNHDSRIRSRNHASHARCGSGRITRHTDDDPVASCVDCRGAWCFEISLRHGLCRSPKGSRLEGIDCRRGQDTHDRECRNR